MDPVDLLKTSMAAATRLARIAERTARGDRARARVRLHAIEAEIERALERGADLRLRKSILSWIPCSGPWRRALDRRADGVRGEALRLQNSLLAERARLRAIGEIVRRAAQARDMAAKADRSLEGLGYPPKDIVSRATRALARNRFLVKTAPGGEDRDAAWAGQAVAIVEETVEVARDWARARAVVDRRRRVEAARQDAGQATPPARRIYLPVPATLDPVARQAGALYDRSAPKGVSPWFVTHDMPLARFRNLLPLAARPVSAGLAFPPIPYNAAGQNLWGIFDKGTWDHIRRQSYATAGRRCVVCGGRGEGFLAEKVFTPEERASGVDCHEVWDWRVPQVEDGVGVQRLQKLLVVCKNCHVMFHSAFFLRRARENGAEHEVAQAIEKRRMLVNRMTRDQLGAEIEAQSEHLRRAAGVDRWVLDLSHLAAQNYMGHHVPILVEDNPANFPPERIAGLAFETDRGRRFPARSVREVYGEMGTGPREPPADARIVPFPRR